MSVSLSQCLSVCLSVCLLSFCLSVCLSICLSVCLNLSLSVYLVPACIVAGVQPDGSVRQPAQGVQAQLTWQKVFKEIKKNIFILALANARGDDKGSKINNSNIPFSLFILLYF